MPESKDLRSLTIWRAILISLGILVLRSFVKEFIDHADKLVDSNKNTVYVSSSNVSRRVNILGLVLHILNLVNYMLMYFKSNSTKNTSTKSFFLITPISLSLLINASHWDFSRSVEILLFLLYLFIIGNSTLSDVYIQKVSNLFIAITLLSMVFSIIFFEKATLTCRQDKCTFLGGLNKSFFLNENYYAIFLVIGLCFFSFTGSKKVFSTYLISVLACIISTGSRTSLIALVILVFLRFGRNTKRTEIVRVGTLVLTMVSIYILFTANQYAFSGRGQIYQVIRESLSDSLWTGYGMNLIKDYYYDSQSFTFLPGHEHGTAPLYLARFGLLGIIGLIIFLLRSFRVNLTYQKSYDAFMVLSVFGITEPILNPSLYNDFGWLFFLI